MSVAHGLTVWKTASACKLHGVAVAAGVSDRRVTQVKERARDPASALAKPDLHPRCRAVHDRRPDDLDAPGAVDQPCHDLVVHPWAGVDVEVVAVCNPRHYVRGPQQWGRHQRSLGRYRDGATHLGRLAVAFPGAARRCRGHRCGLSAPCTSGVVNGGDDQEQHPDAQDERNRAQDDLQSERSEVLLQHRRVLGRPERRREQTRDEPEELPKSDTIPLTIRNGSVISRNSFLIQTKMKSRRRRLNNMLRKGNGLAADAATWRRTRRGRSCAHSGRR